MFDQLYHDTLKDMHPALYAAIKELVASGQSPQAIAKRTEVVAGKDSVLPGLVEATARFIKQKGDQ